METDPFKLLSRSFIAAARITGHCTAFAVRATHGFTHGERKAVLEAARYLGRGVVRAVREMFRR
jgi:hypothetical protein